MSKGRLALGVLGSRGSRGNQHQPRPSRRSAGPSTGAHQTDHQRRLGPGTGARPASTSSVFCSQVFSEYDPSSAASLLSSAGISARSWGTTREILQWWCTVMEYGQANRSVRSGESRLGWYSVRSVWRYWSTPSHSGPLRATLKATHNTPQLVRFQEEHPVARDSKGLREDGGCPTGAGIIAKLTPWLALIGTLTLCVDRAVFITWFSHTEIHHLKT